MFGNRYGDGVSECSFDGSIESGWREERPREVMEVDEGAKRRRGKFPTWKMWLVGGPRAWLFRSGRSSR